MFTDNSEDHGVSIFGIEGSEDEDVTFQETAVSKETICWI
jgi:hypothetical protein